MPTAEGQSCPFCKGVLVRVDELELRSPGANARLALETRQKSPAFKQTRSCPECSAVMVPWRISALEAWVERCANCELLWLEPADLRSLAMLKGSEQRRAAWKSFSQAQRDEIATDLAGSVRPAAGKLDLELAPELTAGEAVMAVAGLPVLDRLEGEHFPFATLALTVLIGVVFVLGYAVDGLGFDALAVSSSHLGSPRLVSSLVVHAGLVHFVGNAIFLLAFGHAVELKTPHWLVPAVFVGLGVVATLAEGLSGQPGVLIGGASGSISALMGLSVFIQRGARMKVFLFKAIIALPLWVAIGVELLTQLVMWSLGVPGIAWVAHLTGLGCGLLTGALFAKRLISRRV